MTPSKTSSEKTLLDYALKSFVHSEGHIEKLKLAAAMTKTAI
jgi:hypothetical protein